ncbi:DMT family transporter [Tengunoibacter tsumagoiensis]|uniref:Membrane protein n=1 Tax=Tengunoibacter tsumagoiensis TaxID=2014871 RepID=A0A402A413_9CHLR|nr:DMT family transporter [Tengunoibacter tsumagoiensis]GCE13893.1 membrane protein [Tengunoibacter tsumagoiensis]
MAEHKGRRLLRYDLLIIVVTIIWGGTFLVVQDTLKLTGPFTFLFLRFGVGALTLALLFHRRLRQIQRSELLAGSFIGIFLFAGFALQTVGLQYTTVSKAGFITGLYVPFVSLLSLLVLKQIPTIMVWAGVILSFVGLIFLSINSTFQLTFGLGEWLVLGCALANALHIISISKFAPRADAINLSIVQIAFTSLLSLLAIPFAHEPLHLPAASVWISVVFMGVVATAFCLYVMNRVQQFISSTRATLIYALEPAWAALFGYVFARDLLSPLAWLGCLCIFLGMIIGQLPPPAFLRKRSSVNEPVETVELSSGR